MASRTSPPRPSDHSPSCPAYSPSAKYSSCTCGLTTPRKSKRPTFAEATASALAVDAVETEAERKGREQREAMEAAIMSPGTTNQKSISGACPRCSECVGQKHHWLEATVYEPSDPAYECKHCDAACGMRSDGAPNGKLMPRRPDDAGDEEPLAPLVEAAALQVEQPPAAGAAEPARMLDSSKDLAHLLDDVERQVSRAMRRPVAVGPVPDRGYASLAIVQRCAACREVLETTIPNAARFGQPLEGETVRVFGEAGSAARRAYVKHRCEPVEVERQLTGMTATELEQLAQELERDGTEMVNRSIAITKLAKERADG